ncbi:MAG TPA: dipeptidase [Geobacteraceae bacterium]|nr:dipeptidase [Geobacteraceae bacterium]
MLHSNIIGYLQTHSHRFLDELKEFIRFPSISAQPAHTADVARCAAWLAGHMRRIGMENTSLIPTKGHPVVFSEWRRASGRPTVLIYGHYDVQPPEPLDEWRTPPFEPVVRGDYLFARGATDDKGQMFAHVKALETLLAVDGRLPVNAVCLFEGEEEAGSTGILRFLAENGDKLHADLAVISDTLMPSPERPTVIYSLRGSIGLELEVTGQRHDLHSGQFGGMVRNPVQALCEIIARLHDAEGRIAVPGFYGRVKKLSDTEKRYMSETGPSDAELLENAGTEAGWGDARYTLYERTTVRPALTVTGIAGGYQGPGSKGEIPARASAKIDIRLAPRQEPLEIECLFRLFITRTTPPEVRAKVSRYSSVSPVEMNPSHPIYRAVVKACLRGFGGKPLFRRSGGSIPVVTALRENCGIPVALLGFGLADANMHGPNESLYLPNFIRGMATSIHLMRELGRFTT